MKKIRNACEADGVPVPEYTINPGDIMIKFTAPEDKIIRVTDRVTDRVNDNMVKVLNIISEDPGYSYNDIADKVAISRKGVATIIKKLKEQGIIERVGNNKKGYWKIKR